MARELSEYIKAAILSGPVPRLRDWRTLYEQGRMDELTRAEKNMAFVERHCAVPEGKLVGEPLVLGDFQEAFYYALYDNPSVTDDAHLSIARKNSKTATIATIVLVHLVGPEAQLNSEITSGARSREQASQVYRYASKMVSLSPTLSAKVRAIPSSKKLIGLNRNTEYRAIAAEASTSHGGSPVLAILDEVGQVKGPQDDFVDAIITSQGAHERPLLISISTQAPTDNDLFSVWLDDAAKYKPESTVCHLYTTPQDAEMDDRESWKYSNPALGLFRMERDMERMAARAIRMPSSENTFRNLYLNQRVALTNPFVSHSIWMANAAEPEPPQGQAAWGGLDLSMRTDLTAFTLVYEQDDVWQIQSRFWVPEKGLRDRAKRDRVPYEQWVKEGWLIATPGATVDYETVIRDIADLVGDVDLQALAFDRWRIDVFRKEMESLGVDLPLIEVGQGYRSFSPALDTLEADLLNERMAHGSHPVMNMCAANAVVTQDPAGNRKLDKAKANGRIDGMVALAMARFVATTEEAKRRGPSVYEQGVV